MRLTQNYLMVVLVSASELRERMSAMQNELIGPPSNDFA